MPPRHKSNPGRTKGTCRPVISGQLRKILESGEHTLFAIARDSGLGVSSLSRFLSGERDITVGTLDRIADVLGLRLVESGKDKVRPSKSPRPACRSFFGRGESPGDPHESPGDPGRPDLAAGILGMPASPSLDTNPIPDGSRT